MEKKQKYYVVWSGRKPGIYTTWDECKSQVVGVKGARYKSFKTESEALSAQACPPERPTRRTSKAAPTSHSKQLLSPPTYRTDTVLPLPPEVKARAMAVDAACSGNPGPMEYRGVCLTTGQELFRYGPMHGTNNVGEFLAIVHGLALIQQQGLTGMTLYSDSRNALLWVKNKKCKTKLQRTKRTEPLFQLIERAEQWLNTHKWETPVLKWDTGQWGEIPADFGRK